MPLFNKRYRSGIKPCRGENRLPAFIIVRPEPSPLIRDISVNLRFQIVLSDTSAYSLSFSIILAKLFGVSD